ncbi:hypothetical protein [Mesorhizobium sp. BE184]|uniref:hypothetical protein n=1 Tax=Mesorhizobium sp. BE184 TaxID=2817714 RepID=UPI00285A0855|nr:hypothetical protein [Mesorhizobium sp. BE184]MDR7032407.1 hypothetical protein [Mesorhizobium sp. BE184]
MTITAQFLKNIMAEARPIIERQMNDAAIIAGLRTVVANAGGDWGALKALIKAHVEDENDETGEGKRVQKIREKADSTSAYADMLGLANMNEKNFSAETGEITEQPETANRFQAKTSEDNGRITGGAGPVAGEVSRLASGRTDAGGAASADLPTISNPQPTSSPEAEKADLAPMRTEPAGSATIPDDDFTPPAFVAKDRPERNERCEKPLTCQFGHHPQKVTCSTCTTAWQIARRKAVAA